MRGLALALALLGAPALAQLPPGDAPRAKRVAPPVVAPLLVDGLRIVAVEDTRAAGFAQAGGVIEALDAKSGISRWRLKVYDIAYDPRLEGDVQDVFITRLRRGGRHRIRIDDERGRHWMVDLTTRAVTAG